MNLDFVATSQTKSKSKNNLALETILGCLFHTGHKNAQENPKIVLLGCLKKRILGYYVSDFENIWILFKET